MIKQSLATVITFYLYQLTEELTVPKINNNIFKH